MVYHKNAIPLNYRYISAIFSIFLIVGILLYACTYVIRIFLSKIVFIKAIKPYIRQLSQISSIAFIVFGVINLLLVVVIIFLAITKPQKANIKCKVGNAIVRSNLLDLQEGEKLPRIRCENNGDCYELYIELMPKRTDKQMKELAMSISTVLNGKLSNYCVTKADIDELHQWAIYRIENVTSQNQLVASCVDDLLSSDPSKICVQKEIFFNLRYSGSILVAGITRSGKTTGVISILLQLLSIGRDNFNSEIVIIDPKRAELSMLPHTYTLDENGNATTILDAIKTFSDSIRLRQIELNNMSQIDGSIVHWWEAAMHPSVLFIDEYVALRSILPKHGTKDNPNYSLETFDGLIKQIVTMGASAGCYCIISIAEASVGEGGLPTMLKKAMGTKILFRPSKCDDTFLWDKEQTQHLPERMYKAGDAWFSSTDGVNDRVRYVRFPEMNFPVYQELGRLLEEYYQAT